VPRPNKDDFDHDVAEVRAELRTHTQALNALREIQLEHLAENRERFGRVDENFAKVENNFAKVNTGLSHIANLIEGISGSS
jgi:tRNA(Phe) wybutosine-synthesizing methylase Tyw3